MASNRTVQDTDRDLIQQLATALAVEIQNCELKGDKSQHHVHCRALIQQATERNR